MSNGRPATRRDARQDAGFPAARRPARVGRMAAFAYADPERAEVIRALAPTRRTSHFVEARASAIEDARVDCRSTILRNSANLPR